MISRKGAATLDVLRGCDVIDPAMARSGKELLVRVVAMLTKMTARSMQVREENEYAYECEYEYDKQDNRQPQAPGDD